MLFVLLSCRIFLVSTHQTKSEMLCHSAHSHALCLNNNNNNNLLNLYIAFLGTQSTLHRRGESRQPPPMCSIHLDDATAAIVRQNAHHTPAYWWRGDRVMKPISLWGWLGGYDDQRPMGKFGQDARVTPYSFSKHVLGFLMTTESQDLSLTSHPKDGAFYSIVTPSLYWGVRTHTDHRVSTPCSSH